jgi:hypothetical protein
MQCWHERSALATGGHILAPEVRDNGNAGELRERIRITYLQREWVARRALRRFMPDGLSVTANCDYVAWFDPLFCQ